MPGKPGRKWGTLRGEFAETRELASVLRDIADGRAVTVRDLERQMPYGHSTISQNLNGSRRPEWGFVTAFLDACTGGDQQGRALLEARVRPFWNAAALGKLHRAAEVEVLPAAAVPAELRAWVDALHDAARTQQVVARLQLSVSRGYELVGGLMHMLSQLTRAVEELMTERNVLHQELKERGGLAAELAETRAILADTQLRLDAAERLQAETSRRLDGALRQREAAEHLKHEALMQAESARRRLAEVEQHAVRLTGDASADELASADGTNEMASADHAVSALMGNADPRGRSGQPRRPARRGRRTRSGFSLGCHGPRTTPGQRGGQHGQRGTVSLAATSWLPARLDHYSGGPHRGGFSGMALGYRTDNGGLPEQRMAGGDSPGRP